MSRKNTSKSSFTASFFWSMPSMCRRALQISAFALSTPSMVLNGVSQAFMTASDLVEQRLAPQPLARPPVADVIDAGHRLAAVAGWRWSWRRALALALATEMAWVCLRRCPECCYQWNRRSLPWVFPRRPWVCPWGKPCFAAELGLEAHDVVDQRAQLALDHALPARQRAVDTADQADDRVVFLLPAFDQVLVGVRRVFERRGLDLGRSAPRARS